MAILFDHFISDPGSNETEAEEIFQLAIQDARKPEHRPDEIMLLSRVYSFKYGSHALVLVPEDPGVWLQSELTYGLWTTALTGLIDFGRAYPGLNFVYQIHIDVGGKQEDVSLGWGLFWLER